MNLALIAAYIRQENPNDTVKIFDGMIYSNIRTQLTSFKPNIVGVTAVTPQAPAAYRLLDWVKQSLGVNVLTVMGGVHASVKPLEAALYADVVITGDGEYSFNEIINQYRLGEPFSNRVVEGKTVMDLNSMPDPAFELVNFNFYLKYASWFPNLERPIISLVTSRGCPYRCAFCGNAVRKTPVRYLSAERVVKMILYLKKQYNIKSILFNDDEFLINTKRLRELSVLFKETGIDKWLTWGCQARVQTIMQKPILELAKSMGCVFISTGFESSNQRILNYLKDYNTTVEQQEKALQVASEAGITIGGSFILGTPSESLDEMKNVTFKWFEKHAGVKYFGLNTLTPYPGTPIWSLAEKYGLLPKHVNYEMLIPYFNPKHGYIIDDAVNHKAYVRFAVHAARLSWLYSQVRLNKSLKSFVMLSKHQVWLWAWLNHPIKMCYMLRYVLTGVP